MRQISQEAVKVAGQVLSMSGDVSAARRVVVEAAGWLCDVEGVALVDDVAVVPVVQDVFGDTDWAATARGAGWLDADAAGALLVEVEAAREAAAAEQNAAQLATARGAIEARSECDRLRIARDEINAELQTALHDLANTRAALASSNELARTRQAEIDGLRAELIAARVGGKVVDIVPAAPKVDQVVSVPGTLPGRTAAPAPVKSAPAPAPAGDVVERPSAISEAAWASMPPQLRKFAAARAAAAAGQAS